MPLEINHTQTGFPKQSHILKYVHGLLNCLWFISFFLFPVCSGLRLDSWGVTCLNTEKPGSLPVQPVCVNSSAEECLNVIHLVPSLKHKVTFVP